GSGGHAGGGGAGAALQGDWVGAFPRARRGDSRGVAWSRGRRAGLPALPRPPGRGLLPLRRRHRPPQAEWPEHVLLPGLPAVTFSLEDEALDRLGGAVLVDGADDGVGDGSEVRGGVR